jgi:methylglutaconyl-CoA hydratase
VIPQLEEVYVRLIFLLQRLSLLISDMEKPILTYSEQSIGHIKLNRPEKKNALNADMVASIKEALEAFVAEEEIKIVVISAEGDVFCSGADLASLQAMQHNTFEENLEDSQLLKSLFSMIYTMPKLVIAAIQGHALAGGCGLATVCDFAFAVPEAKFGYTEVKIGFVPAIVMFFLLRKIGEAKSRELLIQAKLLAANQALDYGLIHEVVTKEILEPTVLDFARKLIQSNSSQAMGMTKQMLAQMPEKNMTDALDYAAAMNAKARATSDCQRGINAFLNKEKITW